MSAVSFAFTDTRPGVKVEDHDYVRLLGYPTGHVIEDRARELVDSTRQWFTENGRPWIYAHLASEFAIAGRKVVLDGEKFSSTRLQSRFHTSGAHGAVLVAVSAGPECEGEASHRWHDGKPDEYFFLETYGSAVVESLVALAAGRICAWADAMGLSVLPHYSPGYVGWPVSDQPALWRVIASKAGPHFPGEFTVMDTGMLKPKKSLLAVFGLTRHHDRVQNCPVPVPCLNCVLPNCSFRRAPFRV